ncbi:terminase [uncultured Methylobacterium sp.]|uniref:terminase n=1 Tax=uncultured Methylobacterium sp. TaxID=157278 RepID=UPI0035C94B84
MTADALEATRSLLMVPNPGPQTEAYFCEADELYYGGQAGGGKSGLLLGLALNEHTDSLILRRVNDDAKELAKEAQEFAGDHAAGYNGTDKILKLDTGAQVRFGGCQFEQDKERYKGRAKDFYGFDEIPDFTKSQYKFITTWNRSSKPGQRCRVVCAGNPPTTPEGLWVLEYWGAWLDKNHPKYPTPFGALRWYTSDEKGEEVEVEGRGPHMIGGRETYARSRTFIQAKLSDNPFLSGTNYQASLDALPAELRAAYRDGNFQAEIRDDAMQLIPTDWIIAAQDRWNEDGRRGLAMTALAVDPAGGGADAQEMAARYGGWVSEFKTVKGKETADGSAMAGQVVAFRRDACPVIVDGGGGYGGAITMRLKDNDIEAIAFKGGDGTIEVTNDAAKLKFANKRAMAHWRLREALNPDQEGGSIVALPPGNEIKADLAAVRWKLTQKGILMQSKDEIRERIGRSPGKGDVVVMLFSEGDRAAKRAKARRGSGRQSTANMGHQAVRRR